MSPASATDHPAAKDAQHADTVANEGGRPRPETETDLWFDPAIPHDSDDDDLVQLNVYLTGEAFDCLESSSEATGDTKTDVVNRALVMYSAIQDAAARGGCTITFRTQRDQKHRVIIA